MSTHWPKSPPNGTTYSITVTQRSGKNNGRSAAIHAKYLLARLELDTAELQQARKYLINGRRK
ncbi:hypothetical protein [Xenorhabdus indica]|uniref:hypothetical protein n=1 Tax=Xenorhabdus indica TaxID=333964 RepID=UPI0021D4BB81|nr:hypothetical protein [Xenorhabdus indica]